LSIGIIAVAVVAVNQMGRTIPSFRIALEMEKEKEMKVWKF
jgi:hypothetical protein